MVSGSDTAGATFIDRARTTFAGVKSRALKRVFDRHFAWRIEELMGGRVLALDYPVREDSRYPLGQSAHPGLFDWCASQRTAHHDAFAAMESYRANLERVGFVETDGTAPYWGNTWFSALDAMALYTFVAQRRPRNIIEVGSGNSTKFAVRAIRDHQLPTRFLSIDPSPRAEIDILCDEVIREPLESTDLSVFARLQPGDFLFIDSSHRALANSDATALFLDIVPRLPPGVVLHVHDVFLPWDYPEHWRNRYYSEQYLLACVIMAAPARCRLLLSSVFASFDDELRQSLTRAWSGSALGPMFEPGFHYAGVRSLLGTSFWAEIA